MTSGMPEFLILLGVVIVVGVIVLILNLAEEEGYQKRLRRIREDAERSNQDRMRR
jgi:hypothetical protein